MPVTAAAAAGIAQAGIGIWQAYKGSQMTKNLQRPSYEIPQAIKDKMTTAEMLQYQGLPDSSKQEYIDNLSRNMAFQFNQLDSRKAGMAGTATIGQQANDAAKNLLTADAAAQMANINELQNMRSEYGGFQDKQFTFNKANPYYETLNEGRAMQGAGLQNIVGAGNAYVKNISMLNAAKSGGSTSQEGPTPLAIAPPNKGNPYKNPYEESQNFA